MELLPADYVLLGFAFLATATGGVCGLSGIIAFASALGLSVFSAFVLWPFALARVDTPWAAALAVFVAAIIVYAIVRVILKKTVNIMMSQPSDSILGMVVGFVLAVGFVYAWARTGFLAEHSSIVTGVSAYVR